MSGSKNMSLAAKLSGLALCGFMTACNQSTQEPVVQQPSASAADTAAITPNQKFINTAFDIAKKNETPRAEDCRYLLANTLMPAIQKDNSGNMQRAKDIVLDRCPN